MTTNKNTAQTSLKSVTAAVTAAKVWDLSGNTEYGVEEQEAMGKDLGLVKVLEYLNNFQKVLKANLESKKKAKGLTVKAQVEAKEQKDGSIKPPSGAVSIYGLGRFPVTLHKGQWLRLLAMLQDVEVSEVKVPECFVKAFSHPFVVAKAEAHAAEDK